MTKVLFVCLGNICRSPTAEAVLRTRAARLQKQLIVDSAGTANWHQGKTPDQRSCAAAARLGYAMDGLRARQVRGQDFQTFDYILAMDRENLTDLEQVRTGIGTKPQLFLDFAPDLLETEIPDPYYGGEHGFSHVLHLIEQACDGLLAKL